MLLGLFSRKNKDVATLPAFAEQPAAQAADTPDSPRQALRAGRLGALVRQSDDWRNHPHFAAALAEAVQALDDRFALVPEGLVSLPLTIFDQPGEPEVDCETKPFLLARSAVTNADFQHFVDAGGYGDLSLWPEEIWPNLIGFKDQSGEPGPRFWQHGRHDHRLADHPVVGVSYHEAEAYARWAGYRLPLEAEWQMAASWHLRSATHSQRRYPWGDTLDLKCCNIWASAHATTLPVDACKSGAAPNGVLQLVGNVWEWTASDFLCADREGRTVVGDMLMKSIRGGAFDTYFAWQATSAFRTGLGCAARTENVGFRCAMDLLDN